MLAEVGQLGAKLGPLLVQLPPSLAFDAAMPGGWRVLAYYRLYGSPEMYASAYSETYLDALAQQISSLAAPLWCMFDNTALGAATTDALELLAHLEEARHLAIGLP